MPECTDIVDTIELMSFLLFDGQADAGQSLSFQVFNFTGLIKILDQYSKSIYWKKFGTNFEGKQIVVAYFVHGYFQIDRANQTNSPWSGQHFDYALFRFNRKRRIQWLCGETVQKYQVEWLLYTCLEDRRNGGEFQEWRDSTTCGLHTKSLQEK